ncbi:MAG: UDP-4-amino-4,6-dideoxy-N-acetyl-beta-L-altrosamine N-acetyltransferase [candidate division Zixibacteria bacterium]|nr:UDP-4-amino-4,6-dideoxy-N-acetyl-beta-L-altrosamine N-acetyltransferase [candidate division Zixibacteria bacterium]
MSTTKTGQSMRFLKVQPEHLEMLMNWRTRPEVTRYMFTDIEADMESQQQWFARTASDDCFRHWVIEYRGEPIGWLALNDIDWAEKKAFTGFYIGEPGYGMVSSFVLAYLYNHAFSRMGLEKLYAAVMEGNDNMMKFHRLHGFVHVEKKEKHIEKYGRRHDVEIFELTKDSWSARRQRYGKYVAEFPD